MPSARVLLLSEKHVTRLVAGLVRIKIQLARVSGFPSPHCLSGSFWVGLPSVLLMLTRVGGTLKSSLRNLDLYIRKDQDLQEKSIAGLDYECHQSGGGTPEGAGLK